MPPQHDTIIPVEWRNNNNSSNNSNNINNVNINISGPIAPSKSNNSNAASCRRRVIFPSLHREEQISLLQLTTNETLNMKIASSQNDDCPTEETTDNGEADDSASSSSPLPEEAPAIVEPEPQATPLVVAKTTTTNQLVPILRRSSFTKKKKNPPQNKNKSPWGTSNKQLMNSLPSLQLRGTPDENNTNRNDQDTTATCLDLPTLPEKPSYKLGIRRGVSEPTRTLEKCIKFDPRIWIHEFPVKPEEIQEAWYNNDDLETFRRHALALIMAYDQKHHKNDLLVTGTARTVGRRPSLQSTPSRHGNPKMALFTHAAMTLEGDKDNDKEGGNADDDEDEDKSSEEHLRSALHSDQYRAMVAQQEIRNILLVDPHDICITLFRKALGTILPRATFTSASSAEQALERLSQQQQQQQQQNQQQQQQPYFDIILMEERLKPLFHASGNQGRKSPHESGSALFHSLKHCPAAQQALWIGVSAHINKDRAALEESNVDICWSKPPPIMSVALRNELLHILLKKRGRYEIAKELFG